MNNNDKYQPLPDGSWEGIKTYVLVSKLKRLYAVNNKNGVIDYVSGLSGPFFMFDDLYDYVNDQKISIEYAIQEGSSEKDVKFLLWKSAKVSANIWGIRKSRSGVVTKEMVEHMATRIYKSELIYLFLVQKYNIDGLVFDIKDQHGNVLQPLKYNPEEEKRVINVIEIRAKYLNETT
jgi:hypothetical protein